MIPAGASETPDDDRKRAVLEELDRILASPSFRSTKRSQEFLRYVVTLALEGKGGQLKERSIGIEVFDRAADYDTGDDSIVRVKANELRKRLAQHYQEAGPASEVQIELPAGSYVPEFRWQTIGETASAAAAPETRRGRWLIPAVTCLLIAAAAAAVWLGGTSPAIEQFWRPVLNSSKPVLVAVAHPVVYQLTGGSRETPDSVVPLADIIRDPDHYVGVGDALALARFADFFTRMRKPYEPRISTEATFADLRNSPAVLIGAYTNEWTMKVTEGLRFVFDREPGAVMVRDQSSPGHRWVRTPPTDYAIVSRLFDSRTGDLVIVAAGLAHYGTQVAGEFLTNPGYMDEAFRDAPRGWQNKNIQIVLRAEVIGKTAGPPRVLATHYW